MNLISNLSWVALRFGFFFLMLYLVTPGHALELKKDEHFQEFQDALQFLSPIEGPYAGKLLAATDGYYVTPPESCDDFRLEILESDLKLTNRVGGAENSWTVSLLDTTRLQKNLLNQLRSDHNSVTSVWVEKRDLVIERWSNQTWNENGYARSKETLRVQKKADGTLETLTFVRMDYRGQFYRPGSWVPKFQFMKCKNLD